MVSRLVDYESAADVYVQQRTPTDENLAAWGEEVAPHITGGRVVVDLAAGTGAFSNAFLNWGAGHVVAVEPSAAMQSKVLPDNGLQLVRGRAEAIPLRNGMADAIWISTAFHHFQNPELAVSECRRVLTRPGRVLIRGLVPGHSDLVYFEVFPGVEKAAARFPSYDDMNRLFASAGFHLIHADTVDAFALTYADRAAFCEKMRHADSILTALTDEEVDAGIARMRAQPDKIEHFALSFLVFGTD